jgi:ABC-type branched-subunit amino acid transport system substrate-binding protein
MPVCEPASGAPLHVGMSAPISGTSKNLGLEMRKGISLAF